MGQYAIYDSMQSPAIVIGWYDSVNFPLSSAPSSIDLYEVTAAQWAGRMTGTWAIEAGALVSYSTAPPSLTAAQQLQNQAAALMSGGLTITSTSTPALDGTYACDSVAQNNILATQIYIQVNSKFPGSSGTMAWYDQAGTAHLFPTTSEFTPFATAVADFVADCQMVMLSGSGVLPSATATIP